MVEVSMTSVNLQLFELFIVQAILLRGQVFCFSTGLDAGAASQILMNNAKF
jgi:hypothetical protein